jgi:CubicO group peptidase (beta-lactamase class C family)
VFDLSQDHEDFRRVVKEFAAAEIEPHVASWDRAKHFPTDMVGRMGELGLFGLVVPEEFGGSLEHSDGGAFTSLCIAIEELGYVDQSIGITLSAGVGLGINPILTYGTPEQKARFLPDLVAGRALRDPELSEILHWQFRTLDPALHSPGYLGYGMGVEARDLAGHVFRGHRGHWGVLMHVDPISGVTITGTINQSSRRPIPFVTSSFGPQTWNHQS